MDFPSQQVVDSYMNSITDMKDWETQSTDWIIKHNDYQILREANQMFFVESKNLKYDNTPNVNLVVISMFLKWSNNLFRF